MYRHIKIGFLLLIIAQGLHSTEEYFGKLWDVLSPARFLSSLFSDNPESGFLAINTLLFVFGIFCWIVTTGKNKITKQSLIWIWIIIGAFNGVGHPLLALREGSYFPGILTAPVLLILSVYLARELIIYNGLVSTETDNRTKRALVIILL